jgi:hypothetical protein
MKAYGIDAEGIRGVALKTHAGEPPPPEIARLLARAAYTE